MEDQVRFCLDTAIELTLEVSELSDAKAVPYIVAAHLTQSNDTDMG